LTTASDHKDIAKEEEEEQDVGIVDRSHSVDQTTNPEFFIKFVDEGNRLETVQICKKMMSSFLNIQQGQSISDVGCGTGDDVLSLAELVGKTGRVAGVDSSENMIEEAKKRSKLRGGKLSVEFHVGNAHHLDLADNTFDCSRAERLLVHLDDPSKVIAELARVQSQEDKNRYAA
jgi:ubiquinone/menaquinone biosynthesis C-methylase UbiE